MSDVRLKGLQDVQKNLKVAHNKVEANKRQALTRIGIMVKADSVKKTPVDTGNLRGSAYYEVEKDKVRIGYTAAYAAWVHELVDEVLRGLNRTKSKTSTGKGQYWDGGESQFLLKAVRENRRNIMKELIKGKV